MRHPLEEKFNASAWDILSAIEKGFRAQVDVKGKLAEYFLNRELERLKSEGLLEAVEWFDRDAKADFIVKMSSRELRVECKNVRSGAGKAGASGYRLELQKTRNSRDGAPTRGYRASEFDIVAACLFNQTGMWDFLFIATRCLMQRPDMPGVLAIMQPVPISPEGKWHRTFMEAAQDAFEG